MTRYWLSFDLGLRGNYDDLYRWLAKLDARECGDGIATFTTEQTPVQLKRALKPIVGKKGRAYLIGSDKEGKWSGKWLFGNRRPAPWVGYVELAGEEQDDA
ncbi:hypothetical protein [Myxococcus sp. AS-1-15]|uniref:hypothetical protein n=1 Tax=Myxococcus sp. AS-1-15 TaxID=2874600 RepID=UPI001CBAB752|nr:hypothetical protein [Myxococcus sp. AS-1-15]MBZ4396015.1 hypothetical protein [Myxococcus sp. AS-1-15]